MAQTKPRASRWPAIAAITALAMTGIAGAAWLNREALLLTAIKVVAARSDIAPHAPPPWTQEPAVAAAPPAERPPNIIFILADDLGINDISTFGGGLANGAVRTPNIDALAASGAMFVNAYAGAASCAPSRAMIMTGRYPTRTGLEFTPTPDGMGRVVSLLSDTERSGLPPVLYDAAAVDATPSFEQQGLPGSEVTIAEVLKQAGYYTAHIGKWHTGSGPEFGPNAQGFDDALVMASGMYLPEDHPDVVNAKLPFDPIDKFLWARMEYAASFNGGRWFEPGGYLTDWWTDEAIRVIRANKNRPFFLNLAHWGIHTPLQATREDYEAVGPLQPERLRVYAAMLRALDRSVGRIVAALEAEGLADNTLIVFSSDNGGAGYIGIDSVNAPYRGWKLSLFEGGIRAPLFMKWPARIAPRRIETPAAHIDLMPTLAAAGRATLPSDRVIDGQNLLPIATGAPAGAARPIFWRSGDYRVVRYGDWKLQLTGNPKRAFLFNLKDDPTERTDLSAARPDKVAELTALITQQETGRTPPLYPAQLQAPVAIDKTLAQKVEPGDLVVYWPN